MPETAPESRLVEEDEISLLQLLSVMLRRRRTIFLSTVLVSFPALISALHTEKSYTASTSFIPQGSESGVSSLSGLAGQFGFQLPANNPGESPLFYAELVTSREILGSLATEDFSFEVEEGDGRVALTGTLPDLLEMGEEEDPPPLLRQAAIRWLEGGAITVSTGRETGIVTVSIQTPWAGLSWILADRMLELLNEFNLQTRQSQAAAERRFVEDRLAGVQDSLRAAEDRLEGFLDANRLWENSPELVFQQGRLQRHVSMQQQIFTSLAEAHEQARIAEVRNTPVITVVERPELPVKADPRGRVLKLGLGIVLGGMLGVSLAFGQEYLQRAGEEKSEEYQEFSTLWSQSWNGFWPFGSLLGKKRAS